MAKASTELVQQASKRAAAPSPGRSRRGRPCIQIAWEDLLEMASLVLDAPNGRRGHYAAAGLVIARKNPDMDPEAFQARRKLMVRRFLGRKEKLLAEAMARRKPKRQPACVSWNSTGSVSGGIEELLRSYNASIEAITRLADQSRIPLRVLDGTPETTRLAREGLALGALGRSGMNPHDYDPGRSIAQNALHYSADPYTAHLATGGSIADYVARSCFPAPMAALTEARRQLEAHDRLLREHASLCKWTKFT